ncbi:MAG: HEPN domain-containing protein [Armatimonadetes bacterium]|nr:HEPN domain-containing protein [Armatimonadota bacterium]
MFEQARRLLRKAQQDGEAAQRLAEAGTTALWIVGFHAQQAIEKAFKAVLTARGVPHARTHNLVMLFTLLKQQGATPPGSSDEHALLTPFGVAFRYDDTWDPRDVRLDMAAALSLVAKVLAWAQHEVTGGEES